MNDPQDAQLQEALCSLAGPDVLAAAREYAEACASANDKRIEWLFEARLRCLVQREACAFAFDVLETQAASE